MPLLFASVLLLAQTVATRAEGERGPNVLAHLPGEPAAPLGLDRLDGPKLELDGRGRVTLVHFFATWCEPCRPELASLDTLQTESEARGLDILAVSVAEPEGRLRRYFAENPSGLTILLDRDRAASRAWRIEALPSSVVLDRGGRMRLMVRGDPDWARGDVRQALEVLLKETTPTTNEGGKRP